MIDRERIARILDVPVDVLGDPDAVAEYHAAFRRFGDRIVRMAAAFSSMAMAVGGAFDALRRDYPGVWALAAAADRRRRRTARYNERMSARAKSKRRGSWRSHRIR